MASQLDPHTASTIALLRVVGQLVPLVNPVHAPSSSSSCRLRDEVKEVAMDAGEALPGVNVLRLLHSAVDSLSSPPSSPPSFASLAAALSSLSSAVHLLWAAEAFAPPLRALPTELLDLIVDFCQHDEPAERQRTNINLVKTTKTFYRAVQPILEREVVLTTPGQVECLADEVLYGPRTLEGIHSLAFDLVASAVGLQEKDGSWPGRWVLPLIRHCEGLENLTLQLRPDPKVFEDSSRRQPYEMDVLEVLGTTTEEWENLLAMPYLKSLHTPLTSGTVLACNEHLMDIFAPPPARRRIAAWSPGMPQFVHQGEIFNARRLLEENEVDNDDV
ncbi:hypothetical protein JCM8547_000986 [Rhodosporidiobolus lusitaniae]